MENMVYFIYSKNKERDKELARELHGFLLTHIDIIECRIEGQKLLDLSGIVMEERTSGFLDEKEKPICITRNAYNAIIGAEYNRIISEEDQSIKGLLDIMHSKNNKAVKYVFYKMSFEERLKTGEKNIRKLISDIKADPYCWPPR